MAAAKIESRVAALEEEVASLKRRLSEPAKARAHGSRGSTAPSLMIPIFWRRCVSDESIVNLFALGPRNEQRNVNQTPGSNECSF